MKYEASILSFTIEIDGVKNDKNVTKYPPILLNEYEDAGFISKTACNKRQAHYEIVKASREISIEWIRQLFLYSDKLEIIKIERPIYSLLDVKTKGSTQVIYP